MDTALGELFPVKVAFGQYLARWYATVYGDTAATKEFSERGLSHSIKAVPGRMIDDVQSMLASYQRDQQGDHGKNAKLPVMFMAMARDFTTTGADWAGRQLPRRLVCLTDEPGAPVYGLRLSMHDVRTQIAILAAEEVSARSLSAQFSLFVGDMANRRFFATHTFGGVEVPAPVMIENPDVMFGSALESKTMTVLIADITLKVTVPFFDAPKPGEQNDGGSGEGVTPGYPVTKSISVIQAGRHMEGYIDAEGLQWLPAE